MPMLKRDDGEIYYEVRGEGYPVFCLAPGWLRSATNMWPLRPEKPYPWTDWPTLLESAGYRVIAMDQRNAGQSRAAIEADHGWHTYAADQVALIDHLGLKKFNVVGVCIGASFALRLYELILDRINAQVLPQPIGLDPEAPTNFPDRFVGWAEMMLEARPDLDKDKLDAFGHNMWDGEFVYSVSRESVAKNQTPSLVMPGSNVSHPPATGREVVELLPNAELVEQWECPEFEAQQRQSGLDFFARHTP
ncbi:MAG: alpha/beta fold hydrolase [Proteobacteria bacterium]|nr:alpha/beta fold hydrolase [Pseudomonadota bacterium]